MQREERGLGLRADLADDRFDDGVPTVEAVFLDLLLNLLRRVGVALQEPNDLALKRVALAGALGRTGCLKAIPFDPLAHCLEVELELPSDLPRRKFLFQSQVPDLAVRLIVNHG
jgi:hypothetical protein